jgi:heme A synthase
MRTIYRWWLTLLLAAVVVQIGLAGLGAFSALDKAVAGSVDEDGYYDSFFPHAVLGQLIVLGSLVLVILGLAARVGRRRVLQSVGIFALLVAQLMLGWTGQDLPAVLGLLHPINALVILAALGILARQEWLLAREAEPAPEPAIAPPAA